MEVPSMPAEVRSPELDRYELAIEATAEGIWDWYDVEGDAEWWSPQFYRLLGYLPGEIPASLGAFRDFLHPDDHAPTFAAVDAAFQRDEPFEVEYRLRHKSKGYRWFRGRARVFRDTSGRARRMLGSIDDIHERVEARTTLERTTARLALALETAQQATWEWLPASQEVAFSDSWYTMLGYAVKELPESFDTFERLTHPEDLPAALEALDQHLDGRRDDYRAQVRMRQKEGGWKWIEVVGRVQERDAAGSPLRVIGMHVDIDHHRQLEAALSQKNAELERFLYTASHDLKSPLFTIRGFLDRIVRSVDSGELDKVSDYGQRVESAASRMQSKIDGILELARVGGEQPVPAPIRVRPLIDELLSEHLDKPSLRDVAVDVDLAVVEVPMSSDHAQSVLENLISNAVRYGLVNPSPKLRVATEDEAEHWTLLVVEDSGPGVPVEHRAKVFGLFERLHADRESTGMGLTIVARLAEVYGGSAKVETSELGGARFVVRVPKMRGSS